MTPEHQETVGAVAAKLAPSGVPATLLLFGVSLPTLVQLVALVWTLLQISAFIYDRFIKKPKEVHDGRQSR